MSEDKYQAAGVNIDAGNEAAKRYASLAQATKRSEVLGGIGGFAGGFALDIAKYPKPVLLSGTDGVGTKLKVAFAMNQHHTIGIDCVAMCVNDILTSGAEPLFFLDYLSIGKLDVDVAESIVEGVAVGCAEAGCALIGGETAEMPGMYQDGEYDIAGFAVGVVNQPDQIDGSAIVAGDVVLGLRSNGLHSNGYSLVRKIVDEASLSYADKLPGWRGTIGEELLRPTRIYVSAIRAVLEAKMEIHGMAHITGGGLLENIPRCLPANVDVRLSQTAWVRPAVFDWLMQVGEMSFLEAARVWNMGIGFVLIVPANVEADVTRILSAHGEQVVRLGAVIPGQQQVQWNV